MRMSRKILAAFLLLPLFCGAAEPEDPVRAAAEAGDVQAQFRLANEYFTGTETRKRNETLAAHWFLVVAEKGYPEGMFNYAVCLDRGLGVERDPFLAAEYYRKAAEKGTVPYAVFNHAQILRKGITVRDEKDRRKMPPGYHFVPQEKEAVALLEQLAEKGFAPAKAELAEIRLLKEDPMSAEEAAAVFRLLTDAARSPEAPAKTFRLLADCYYGGIGTRMDPEKMIRCLETAADRGDVSAIVKLAYCHEFGLNTAPDEEKALTLYRKAADMGIAMAQCKVAEAIEKGKYRDPDGLGAADWYTRAAFQDWPQACFRLAEILLDDTSSGKSAAFALKLLKRAAEKDLPRAQYRLGLLYLEKDGPAGYDPSAAVYWFRLGAKKGDLPCMRELAKCLLVGKGCDPNRAEAYQWLRAAEKEGDILAGEMLKNQ